MQITHEEAHRLIQFRSDKRLEVKNETDLNNHLFACVACREYSEEIRNVENILQQTMRKQWNIRPLPLQMGAILGNINSNKRAGVFLTTRTAIISLVFVLFAFIVWQSTSTKTAPMQVPFGTLPLIPTPSNQYTATDTLQKECGEIRYIVQKGDTLDSLAQRFSTTKESIINANHLTSDMLTISQELSIPYCGSTPTGTTHPPTFTITPIFETTSTTPG